MPLKLVRRKGSPHFYLRGTVRGAHLFETTGTDDRAAAEAIRIKREGGLLERSIFGAGTTVTFAEAAVSYLENGGEARFLGRYDGAAGQWTLLIGQLGKFLVGQIGQAEVDSAAIALYPHGKPATRRRQAYIPAIAVLHHAARKGWRAPPMIDIPKVKRSERHYSTPERLNLLLPHCSPKLARLVVMLTYTGARISELLRLDWDLHMDLAHRRAVIGRTKNGKPRFVHLPDPVLLMLAAIPQEQRHGQVFKWASRHSVYGPLRRACKRAGVEYLPTHQQGRHTLATWLRLYAKLDLRGTMEAVGWDSVQSAMGYQHIEIGETARAVDRLPSVQNLIQSAPASARKARK